MSIVNANSPRKGLQIGSIRIFENNTKFEVDIRGINGFTSCFRNVSFNGLPFTLTEVKERFSRERSNGREWGRESGGGRKKSAASSKWRSEKRRNEGSTRGRFGEKKRGIESGGKRFRKK